MLKQALQLKLLYMKRDMKDFYNGYVANFLIDPVLSRIEQIDPWTSLIRKLRKNEIRVVEVSVVEYPEPISVLRTTFPDGRTVRENAYVEMEVLGRKDKKSVHDKIDCTGMETVNEHLQEMRENGIYHMYRYEYALEGI